MSSNFSQLEDSIRYSFRDKGLLLEAMTHKSALGDQTIGSDRKSVRSYERLEFLGDAALDLLVGELLMITIPDAPEGMLSKLRSSLVNQGQLAQRALDLELGEFVVLGKGEDTEKGRRRAGLLADVYESLVGALYLDAGIDQVKKLVAQQFLPLIESESDRSRLLADPKTQLQEFVQHIGREPPRYILVEASGPDHDKEFTIALEWEGKTWARATGSTKKHGEQAAASIALDKLEKLNLTSEDDLQAIVKHGEPDSSNKSQS